MNKAWVMCAAVAVFGAAGSLARYGVAVGFRTLTDYPAGTLVVNVAGAFALGLVYAALKDVPGQDVWRVALGVGFLGGLTTFSSMMFDADSMMTEAQYVKAAAYLAASVFLGMLAVRAGAMAAGAIVGKGM